MIPHSSLLMLALLAVGNTDSRVYAAVQSSQAAARAEVTTAADPIHSLIPVGTFTVAVMDFVTSPRLKELTQRFQIAVQSDPAWLLEYTKANDRPGVPLPYHSKMGLSEVEYREMLSLLGEMRLSSVANAVLTVRAEPNRRFILDGGSTLPELT